MDPLDPTSFNHRTETLGNGRTLHFVDQLPENYTLNHTPALVLLHGFPEFWYEWRYQIAPWVSRGWRVIVPDLPGYGQSDKPDGVENYTGISVSSDVNALVDHLQLDRIVLVAHDWGAAFAWTFAQRWPQKLRALVSVSIAYSPPLPTMVTNHQLGEMMPEMLGYWTYMSTDKAAEDMQIRLPRVFDMFYRSFDNKLELFGPGQLESILLADDLSPSDILTEEEKQIYVSTFRDGGIAKPLLIYRALPTQITQEAALKIHPEIPGSLPVLLLAPDGEPFCSEKAVASSQHLVPSLEVIRLRAYHWVLIEKKKEVAEIIGDWIQSKIQVLG